MGSKKKMKPTALMNAKEVLVVVAMEPMVEVGVVVAAAQLCRSLVRPR